MLKGFITGPWCCGIGEGAGIRFRAAVGAVADGDGLISRSSIWWRRSGFGSRRSWGAVVWLTAAVSMAAVEVFFPQIYGGLWSSS